MFSGMGMLARAAALSSLARTPAGWMMCRRKSASVAAILALAEESFRVVGAYR